MITIAKVAINQSDYREHDFDITHCSTINQRWQLDCYIDNPEYHGDLDEEDEFFICTVHFTSYSHLGYTLTNRNLIDMNREFNKTEAYEFFRNALLDLSHYYEEEPTYPSNCYHTMEHNETGLNHNGFSSFIDKYYPISLHGQSKKELFIQLDKAHYIFYSSLKLISYPFDATGVCNGASAWDDIEDFKRFINEPPPLDLTLIQDSVY